MNNSPAGVMYLVANNIGKFESCVYFDHALGFPPGIVIVIGMGYQELRSKLRIEGKSRNEIDTTLERLRVFHNNMSLINDHYGDQKFHEVPAGRSTKGKSEDLIAFLKPWIRREVANKGKFTGGYVPVAMAFDFSRQPGVLSTSARDSNMKYLQSTETTMQEVVGEMNKTPAGCNFLVANYIGTLESCVSFDEALGFSPGLVIVLTMRELQLRNQLSWEPMSRNEVAMALRSLQSFNNNMVPIRKHYGANKCHEVILNRETNENRDNLNLILQPWVRRETWMAKKRRSHAERDAMAAELIRDEEEAKRQEADGYSEREESYSGSGVDDYNKDSGEESVDDREDMLEEYDTEEGYTSEDSYYSEPVYYSDDDIDLFSDDSEDSDSEDWE